VDVRDVEVIAPNLKRRYSGVTSTVLRLVPVQARDIGIAAAGPVLPEGIPRVPLSALPVLPRDRWRVWHARRNVEMLAGLMMRGLLGRRLKLLFTSAAQRRHSAYTRWLLRRMDAVVATSARAAGYLERPATVIRHGIDTDLFHPVEDRAALRRGLGLPEDGLVIGCFGRVRRQKGTDLFVEAMISVLPEHPGAVAVVMGGVTKDQEGFVQGLRTRIAGAGMEERIRVLPEDRGWSIAPWFQACDLYVAPHRWEGFGLTPLEAMACGVPVVATRAGAFEEQVAPGETGLLVPTDDLHALRTAIREALSDKARLQRWGRAARERLLREFRIEGEAAALLKVYRGLLDEVAD
jgi:mannosyltransferase